VCSASGCESAAVTAGRSGASQAEHVRLLKRPGVLAGMSAIFMAFAGQFAFFTYIRPVL
jgi:DHA1 family purine ribonucleoside efflux pump-like MFS transporter